jgi:protein-histidine pros-kinase
MRALVQRTRDHCDAILSACQQIVAMADQIRELKPMRATDVQDTAAFLNHFIQAMPGLVVELIGGVDDPIIIMATATIESLFGYAPGQLDGKPLSTIVPPDKRDAHRSHIAQFVKHPTDRQMGNLGNVDPEGYTIDGIRFPIAVTWRRFFVESRQFLAAAVMTQVKEAATSGIIGLH